MRQSHAVRVPAPTRPHHTDEALGGGSPASPAVSPSAAGGAAAGAAANDGLDAAARELHAVTVETIFAGTSVATRLLPAAREAARAAAGPRFLAAGAALLAIAFAMFVAANVTAADERRAFAAWTASGHAPATFVKPSRRSAPLDVLFGLGLLGGGALTALGLHRRADDSRRLRRSFSIGSTADADAPVDPTYVGAALHELVTHSQVSGDYLIHPTPSMDGTIESGGRTFPLTEVVPRPGDRFRLPPGARARLTCGRTTFVIRSIPRPAPMGRGRRRLDAPELPYTLGAAIALGLFVLMIYTVPPDPRSLSLDLMGASPRLISFNVVPPTLDDSLFPAAMHPGGDGPAGESSPAAAGPSGASGAATSPTRDARRREVPRAATRPPVRLTEQESVEQVKNAGILGLLQAPRSQHLAEVLESGAALGDPSAVDDVLGHLAGTEVASAFGAGGLGVLGTGSGGGGTHEGLRGAGGLTTVGAGRGGAGGYGRAGGVGSLASRRAHTPDIIPSVAHVNGSLDKEIVRRIIHRHINEVRYCFEEELRKRPNLAGRVGVQFAIAGNGRVITSVLQSSTIANRAVENCTVAAVRRWEFPQPQGGGLVMVSYPFVFAPAQ